MTNTKQVGDVTEVRILAALIEAGYSVSIPFGDNDKYDLILDTDDALHRVQCKTGWVEDGEVVRFKTASKTTRNGEPTTHDYDGHVDAFAVRCRDTESLYWVPVEDAGRKSTYLRLSEPEIDHPRVNRASEFRLHESHP